MRRHLAFLLLAALPAAAQHIDDPANLMGERVSPPALADTLPINHRAPALEQLLRKLRTRASMMLIVAHPDDEDGGLLTLESRGMGARVAMLTLNRGEGGQNLMSADFNDALGLIRTQELLAADRYMGVDQFFGTEVDFGFSKTKEESFRKWTHERVLYDAVRAVRLYRPLVLASVFIGEPTDGHGQHQVAGEICQEVFLAAADPKVFPEMGLPPWAPLKVYARVPFAQIDARGMYDYATGKYLPPRFENYVTGKISNTPPTATVTIHEGDKPDIPAFEGKSYIQFARQGLALQKSQIGPNVRIPPAGAFDVGYTLYGSRTSCIATKAGCPIQSAGSSQNEWASAKPTPLPTSTQNQDLFTGIDTTFPGLATLAPSAPAKLRAVLGVIDLQTAEAQKLYDPAHIELTAPPLTRTLKLLDNLIHDTEASSLPQTEKFNLLHELRIKRVQCNNALVLALGVTLTAQLESDPPRPEGAIVSGAGHQIKIEVSQSANVHLEAVTLTGTKDLLKHLTPIKEMSGSSTITFSSAFDLPGETPNTRPYFTRADNEQPYYNLSDPNLRNAAATPDPLVCSAKLDYEGALLELTSVLAAEDTRNAVQIVPRLSLSLRPTSGIIPLAQPTFSVVAETRGFNGPLHGAIEMDTPLSWRVKRLQPQTTSSADPDVLLASFSFAPDRLSNGATTPVKAIATYANHTYSEGFRRVGYPGLTYTNYYTPAIYKATAVDVTTAPNLHIAYLPGTGDEVPQFLPSLGVSPTILTTKDLTLANLKQYDAILLGVRAYSAHPELSGAGSQPLIEYAKQGGVVIAQYNSGGFNPASAPFPYTLPGDPAHNVVEEEQPVVLLKPDAPLLTWPNRIASADFDHWVEERGHGFASEWAPEYTPLLETHDAGQDPQRGGLLVAPIGKGAYIYCAFALYRQLPEGVPGAYRLLANLLSYARNPHR